MYWPVMEQKFKKEKCIFYGKSLRSADQQDKVPALCALPGPLCPEVLTAQPFNVSPATPPHRLHSTVV